MVSQLLQFNLGSFLFQHWWQIGIIILVILLLIFVKPLWRILLWILKSIWKLLKLIFSPLINGFKAIKEAKGENKKPRE